MKIIDLLNKIANGEEVPKKIEYQNKIYHIDELEHFYINDDRKALLEYIFDYLNDYDALMSEVEILEEEKKIPEKIEYYDDSIAWVIDDVGQLSDVDKVIIDTLNGVIDYLKSKGE